MIGKVICIPFFDASWFLVTSSFIPDHADKSHGGEERDNLKLLFRSIFFFLLEFSPSTPIYPPESKKTRLDE